MMDLQLNNNSNSKAADMADRPADNNNNNNNKGKASNNNNQALRIPPVQPHSSLGSARPKTRIPPVGILGSTIQTVMVTNEF